jgi:hypothetical protein
LAPAADELRARYAKARERLRAGAAGLIEVDAVGEALYGVQGALAADDAERARLGAAPAGAALPERATLERLVTRWEDAERDKRANEQDRRDASLWDVNLAAGYQRQRADDAVRPGLYASLELRVNLGSATHAPFEEPTSSLYRAWLEGAGAELAAKQRQAVDDLATRVAELEQRLPLALERQTTLAEYAKATEALGARAGVPQQAAAIYGKWALAKAEAEGVRAEIEALRRFLDPSAAAAAPAAAAGAAPESLEPSNPLEKATPAAPFAKRTDVPNYRWNTPRAHPDKAAVRFAVVGNTSQVAHLGSGDVRHQLGLMLRMQDQCNLVYAVWRMGEDKIVVQEKRNPGQSTHAQCENHGYSTVKPRRQVALPPLAFGAPHELAARIDATSMTVTVDGAAVWVGPAPAKVKAGGSVGLRADNLVVDYTLLDEGAP